MSDVPNPSALTEVPGVETPGPPEDLRERIRRSRRRRLTKEQYVEGVLRGDRVALARAITLIESSRAEDAELAQDILQECLPHVQPSVRVGITGVPGAGKSSLIETLGCYLIRDRGEKVAVLAVDPTSEISGGSILGDKTRMEKLGSSDRAFIRPSPAGSTLGGVARKTRETMLLCEAAGYHNIIVETVGVGQSETAVRSMVDFFLLLALSGAGDELQGMKRGIVETADLVAVNKADGDNKRRAEMARRDYENAQRMFPPSPSGWQPRAVTCSAKTGDGIVDLWEAVLDHHAMTLASGWYERSRREQSKRWMQDMIEWGLRDRFHRNPDVAARIHELQNEVAAGRVSAFRAAQELLSLYDQSRGELI